MNPGFAPAARNSTGLLLPPNQSPEFAPVQKPTIEAAMQAILAVTRRSNTAPAHCTAPVMKSVDNVL
jgi:hypothetical protein